MKSGIFSKPCPLMHRHALKESGCGKWRVITDLRCPLGSILSAPPSRMSTMGETDSITDVSHRGLQLQCIDMTIHTNEHCIHVQNCEMCPENCEAGGEKKGLNFWFI